MSIRVQADGLGRDFGRKQALGEVSLRVSAGRVAALLGPNGAGKTTMMRLLMGLIEPTRGGSTVLGHPSRRLPADGASRLAWVGEGHDPPRWATGRMLMRLQTAAVGGRFDRALAAAMLAERGLSPAQRFGSMSKGQRRWLLATVALAGRPDVLIMDEPADGMDPAARSDLYGHLRAHVTQTDAVALIATHIIADIERVADDVMIIQHGRLLLHESLEDMREQVREIELPDAAPGEAVGNAQILAEERRDGVRRIWARCTSGDWPDGVPAGKAEVIVRPFNLESFYLAMTGSTETPMTTTKEAVACA